MPKHIHTHTLTHTHTHTHTLTNTLTLHSHTPPLRTCLFDTTLTYMCADGCPDGEGSGAAGSLPDTPYLDQQNILRTATLIAKEDRGTKETGEREKLVNAWERERERNYLQLSLLDPQCQWSFVNQPVVFSCEVKVLEQLSNWMTGPVQRQYVQPLLVVTESLAVPDMVNPCLLTRMFWGERGRRRKRRRRWGGGGGGGSDRSGGGRD